MTTEAPATALERRTRTLADAGGRLIRAAEGAEGALRFEGHAAVFNSRTSIGNPLRYGWYEECDPGCFDTTLAADDQRFLVDHDTRLLVSRVSAEDLRLSIDDRGLAVDSDLDQEVTYIRDLARNVEKRRITGMSFGFRVRKDSWSSIEVEVVGGDGKTTKADALLRVIEDVQLLEVSAVTFPAYEDTDAALRKARVEEVRSTLGVPAPPAPSQIPAQRQAVDPFEDHYRALNARFGRRASRR